ncbi:MAG: hypothetical protein ABTQ32_32960 [Myxococcaceae bacterium]
MLELFSEGRGLTLSIVESRRAPADEPTSFIVTLAAASPAGLVGLSIELAMLNGARAVHPVRLSSIGAPTETLIVACGGKSAAEPTPWALDGFATSEWRETSQRTPIHFKPQELTWERARFSLTLTVGSRQESGMLELAVEQERCSLDFEVRRFGALLERARRG